MRIRDLRFAICALMVMAGLEAGVTAELQFSWLANGEPDLAGYKLYQGPQPAVYTNVIVILAPATRFALRVEGTNYFALSAFTVDGLESGLTAPLLYRPPPARPVVPGGFEGAVLWMVTEQACAGFFWEPTITNEVAALWPLEVFRLRMERSALPHP